MCQLSAGVSLVLTPEAAPGRTVTCVGLAAEMAAVARTPESFSTPGLSSQAYSWHDGPRVPGG